MTMKRWLWIAVLALPFSASAGASGASADAPAHLAQPADELVISFDPPLDQPLPYEVVIAKKSTNRDEEKRYHQNVRFTRRGDGYVMTIETVKGSVAVLESVGFSFDQIDQLPPFLRPFFAPVELELNAQGEILRMLEWDKLSKALLAAVGPLTMLVESDPAKRPEARKVFDEIFGQIAALSDSDAPQVMVKGWTSVMGYAGLSGEAGRRYPGEGVLPPGMLPVPISTRGHYMLERDADGIRYVETSEIDGEQMRAGLNAYLTKLAEGLPKENRAKVEAGMAALQEMEVSDRADISFGADGLPLRASFVREIRDGTGQVGTEAIEIRRLPTPSAP